MRENEKLIEKIGNAEIREFFHWTKPEFSLFFLVYIDGKQINKHFQNVESAKKFIKKKKH